MESPDEIRTKYATPPDESPRSRKRRLKNKSNAKYRYYKRLKHSGISPSRMDNNVSPYALALPSSMTERSHSPIGKTRRLSFNQSSANSYGDESLDSSKNEHIPFITQAKPKQEKVELSSPDNIHMTENKEQIFVGVDGGGTSTVCVVIKAYSNFAYSNYEVVGRGESSSSNHNSVGEKGAQLALEKCIHAALSSCNLSPASVTSICLGLSGVDRNEDRLMVMRWIKPVFSEEGENLNVKVHVFNDAVGALSSGTEGQLLGCVLISGTGTIAYGVNHDGDMARASGAGPLLGDKGSGYSISSEALAAVMRAYDGRGMHTSLTQIILNHLQLANCKDLIGWAYKQPGWSSIASLAPLVMRCAFSGDKIAQAILKEATQELALSISAVVKKLNLAGPDDKNSFPVVLAGGIFEDNFHWNMFHKLSSEIMQLFPCAQIIKPKVEPAVGAALLAWRKSGEENSSIS